jgi:hypothetical protein
MQHRAAIPETLDTREHLEKTSPEAFGGRFQLILDDSGHYYRGY